MKARPGIGTAFTLLELLIVLVVVAILAGLLLPALQSVRESGNTTKDVANLRQMGVILNFFINDNGYYPGEHWTDLVHPRYLSSWRVLLSPFDRRAPAETDDAPISYDINSNLWGADTFHVVSPVNCIVAAPLTDDGPTLKFLSTASQPSLPIPLNRESNGSGASGGTCRNRTQIPVLFADLHASIISMSTFHSALNNPNTGQTITDIRWNQSGAGSWPER